MPVYAKPLTLHKGVDNQLQFQFLNQEQKPVDITGKEITCRILNYEGNQLLLQKALTPQLAATGITSLFLNAADIENIDAQKCYYTLEIPVGSFDFPVFVDRHFYRIRGVGDYALVFEPWSLLLFIDLTTNFCEMTSLVIRVILCCGI